MEIIGLLRAERQALVERLSEIDQMLRQYEELDRIAQTLLEPSTSSARATDSRKPDVNSQSPDADRLPPAMGVTPNTMRGLVGRKKTPTDEFERLVIDILRDANAPLDRAELYDALTERGVVIGDGNRDKELNALSARLYRMAQAGHLDSKRGQGYLLKVNEIIEKPVPFGSEGEALSIDTDLDDLLS